MIKVGIIGGTGYTGVELLRLLAVHPQVSLELITSRGEAGRRVDELFHSLRGYVDLAYVKEDFVKRGILTEDDAAPSSSSEGSAA